MTCSDDADTCTSCSSSNRVTPSCDCKIGYIELSNLECSPCLYYFGTCIEICPINTYYDSDNNECILVECKNGSYAEVVDDMKICLLCNY